MDGTLENVADAYEAGEPLSGEERLRLAARAVRLGTWEHDLVSQVGTWDETARVVMGLPDGVHRYDDSRWLDVVLPADRARVAEAFEASLAPGGPPYDIEFRSATPAADGSLRWLASTGTVLRDRVTGEALRVVGTVRDVTGRRRDQERIRQSETHLSAIFDQASVGLSETDAQGRFLRVNARYCEIVGRSREDLLQLRMHDLTHPDDLVGNVPLFRDLTESGRSFEIVKRYLRPDGSTVWVHNNVTVVRDAEGRLENVLCVTVDLTQQRQAEAALRDLNETLEQRVEQALAERLVEQRRALEAESAQREADALYRAYFQNSADGIFVIDVAPEGGFSIRESNPANKAVLASLGLDIPYGRPLGEQLPPEAAAAVAANYSRVIETRAVQRYPESVTINGVTMHFETILVPVSNAEGRIARIVGSSRDLTAQVQAEEALRQSQKLESMGQLTGGVAHDFNNLLTPIVAVLDRLQRQETIGDRERRLIAGAAQSADRARTLVQRLLAFARRQPLQPLAVDVPGLVRGIADLIGSTVGPKIQVVVDVPDHLPAANADPNQVEMALLNLAVNARDAMPEGGVLRLSVVAETIDHPQECGPSAGGYIRLSVSDTGVGMDAETLARAVEPFFSTKGIGKGTGLGLSMVHGLASQLGGALSIKSHPGAGTTVDLWLPESPDGLEEALPRSEVPPAEGQRGTALLVEDDDLVRVSTADMLTELGYTVIETDSAEEASKRLRRDPAPDVIISDHLMPGMSGTEFACHVRVEHPGLPVLIISGYAELAGVDPDLPRLAKPFRKDELEMELAKLRHSR